MRAILVQEGKTVDLYVLDNNGENIINDFFENKLIKNQHKTILAGFKKVNNAILENGYYGIPPEQFKCWKEKKKKEIFEIIKGSFRILCFKYDGGKKLLLVKHIVKKRNKEKKEYQHAINMNETFKQNQIWEQKND